MVWKNKGWLKVHVFLGIFVLALMAAMAWHVYAGSSRDVTLGLNQENPNYDMGFEIAKWWGEESHGYAYGMQYDGFIQNNTGNNISDWTIRLQIEGPYHLDSFWNGEFVCEDSEIVITPVDYNRVVDAGGRQTIGFVAYMNSMEALRDAKITFRRQLRIVDLPLFWCLLLGLALFAAVDITNIINAVKTRRLEARQEEFLDIVNQSFLTFANIIDAKDNYTKGHSQRVAIYSREIARRIGMSEDKCRSLFYIALMHDVGKIGISDAVLKKAGKLTPEERREIEEHVRIGGDIMKDFSAIDGIADGARYHHERYDGKGYLEGKKGKEIPLYARIIGVADAFDAMTSKRCYRSELPMDVVVEELKSCSGTQFDPDIVVHMLAMINKGMAPIKATEESLRAELFSIHTNLKKK